MWRAGILAIALCLVAGASDWAWAQNAAAGGSGKLQAVSYREVPDRLTLSVTLFDDSNINLRIKEQMVASLERAKHSLGDNALFELELMSEVTPGKLGGATPSLGRLSSNNDNSQIEMNIWSSSQDSILGGRYSDRPRRIASRFEIHATLRERSLGQVVWEGRASRHITLPC